MGYYNSSDYKKLRESINLQKFIDKIAAERYGYWTDDCHDEVDGDPAYYCKRCIQPECSKRLAESKYILY